VFTASLRVRESPEAHEGLALASWWLDDAQVVFESRERAYRLYLDQGDRRAAARVAVWVAWDCWAFRGESAVANGWLQRARRHLDGEADCAERAWLELREGSMRLFEEGDPDRAHAMATEAIRIARAIGNIDLEMLGRAVQGLALVTSGAIVEGLRLLDEVNTAVVAGEMHDLLSIGLSCCFMIAACERVRDYDRAVQWCKRAKEFCAKWGLRPMYAVCRTQYASVCMWRGTWSEAEAELMSARDEFAASRPAMTADALVRLAELRRRQGRLTEAAALLGDAEPHGSALLVAAQLAFDRGDFRAASEQAARFLRGVPMHNRTERAFGLELLVRASVSLGDLDAAKNAHVELAAIANIVATAPLHASSRLAAGWIAIAAGDADEARRSFEDAVDGFLQSGAPFEVARARIELARALVTLGRREAAAEEAQRAVELLKELNAVLELARAHDVLRSADAASHPGAGLTKRELQVLRLVADGLQNQAIAARLFVSDHTVHRHLANILNKLSVSSRAAAVAQAARRGLLG